MYERILSFLPGGSSGVFVSGCLVGMNCRYDGKNKCNTRLLDILQGITVVFECPEQLGGLPTPRSPSEIEEGDGYDVLDSVAEVINELGHNVTSAFIKGAEETLKIIQSMEITHALLKSRSPSCGVASIKKEDTIITGSGVTAALLTENDISIMGIK